MADNAKFPGVEPADNNPDEYAVRKILRLGLDKAKGSIEGDRCYECFWYEKHGLHWDTCRNRGEIHAGWVTPEEFQRAKEISKRQEADFAALQDWAIKHGFGPVVKQSDLYYTPPALRVDPRYTLPFSPPTPNILNSLVEEKVDQMTLKPDPLRKPFKEGDEIEHPAHYNMFPVEAIDVCEHLGFNLGNVVKYVMRADFKGSKITDLKKALFYLEREIARTEDAPIPDVLDDWWHGADQSTLARVVHVWLVDNDYVDEDTYLSTSINVNIPWEARFKKRGGREETINFDHAQKTEIIQAYNLRAM